MVASWSEPETQVASSATEHRDVSPEREPRGGGGNEVTPFQREEGTSYSCEDAFTFKNGEGTTEFEAKTAVEELCAHVESSLAACSPPAAVSSAGGVAEVGAEECVEMEEGNLIVDEADAVVTASTQEGRAAQIEPPLNNSPGDGANQDGSSHMCPFCRQAFQDHPALYIHVWFKHHYDLSKDVPDPTMDTAAGGSMDSVPVSAAATIQIVKPVQLGGSNTQGLLATTQAGVGFPRIGQKPDAATLEQMIKWTQTRLARTTYELAHMKMSRFSLSVSGERKLEALVDKSQPFESLGGSYFKRQQRRLTGESSEEECIGETRSPQREPHPPQSKKRSSPVRKRPPVTTSSNCQQQPHLPQFSQPSATQTAPNLPPGGLPGFPGGNLPLMMSQFQQQQEMIQQQQQFQQQLHQQQQQQQQQQLDPNLLQTLLLQHYLRMPPQAMQMQQSDNQLPNLMSALAGGMPPFGGPFPGPGLHPYQLAANPLLSGLLPLLQQQQQHQAALQQQITQQTQDRQQKQHLELQKQGPPNPDDILSRYISQIQMPPAAAEPRPEAATGTSSAASTPQSEGTADVSEQERVCIEMLMKMSGVPPKTDQHEVEEAGEELKTAPAHSPSISDVGSSSPDSGFLQDSCEEKRAEAGRETAQVCGECGFKAKWPSELASHMKNHSNSRPWRCPACPYASKWRWDVAKHMRKCIGPADMEAEPIYMTTSRKNGAPNVIPPSEVPPIVRSSASPQGGSDKSDESSCHRTSAARVPAWLPQVLKRKNPDECDSTEVEIKSVKCAEDCEAAGGAFSCLRCSFTTFKRHQLELHNTTCGVKPVVFTYNCTQCPYQTNSNTNFRNHEKHHGTEGEFKCRYCDWSAARHSAAARHMQIVHKHSRGDGDESNCHDNGGAIRVSVPTN